jgi:acid stress-induced BolA-like protein IbaG/YrbA
MASHSADFQGCIVDALREAIEQQIPHSRADVNGANGCFKIEVTSPAFAGRGLLESYWLVYVAIDHLLHGDESPVQAVDSLKTRTPSPLEPGFAGRGCSPAFEMKQATGVQT